MSFDSGKDSSAFLPSFTAERASRINRWLYILFFTACSAISADRGMDITAEEKIKTICLNMHLFSPDGLAYGRPVSENADGKWSGRPHTHYLSGDDSRQLF